MEFAQWHVKRPVLRSERAEAIQAEIETLADADSREAEQSQSVSPDRVGALQLGLQELIVFVRKCPGQIDRQRRKVVGKNQVGRNGGVRDTEVTDCSV